MKQRSPPRCASRFSYGLSIVLLIAAFDLVGCTSVERDAGFTVSDRQRSLVAEAIQQANSILGSSCPLHFRPSWSPPSNSGRETIVVHLIVAGSAKPPSVAFVPPRKRRVFIDDQNVADLGKVELDADLDAMLVPAVEGFLVKELAAAGRYRVAPVEALAFVLLHEAGHLLNRDEAASFGSPLTEATTPSADITRQMNWLKERELAADWHVLEALRTALKEPMDSPRHQSADAVLDTLRATRLHLSASAVKWRHGGPDSLFAQLSFGDAQVTHPNLEYRIALIVYAMEPTLTNRTAVRQFLEHRSRRWGLLRHTLDPEGEFKKRLEADLEIQLERDMRALEKRIGLDSDN